MLLLSVFVGLLAFASATPARKPMHAPAGLAARGPNSPGPCNPAEYAYYRWALDQRADKQEAITRRFLGQMAYSDLWAAMVANGTVPEYMDPNVKGFTLPLDYYDNANGAVGYIIGGTNALVPDARIRPVSLAPEDHRIDFVHCGLNRCSFQTLSTTRVQIAPGFLVPANLTFQGWFGFDEQDRIASIVTDVPNMADKNNVVENIVYDNLPDEIKPRVIRRSVHAEELCTRIMETCTGANQQYDDVEACTTYLASIPLGGFQMANRKTQMCTHLHYGLAGDQPDVHCPHVGPTGGGMQCQNRHLPGGSDMNGIPFGTAYTDNLLAFLNERVDANPLTSGIKVCPAA